MLFEVDVCACLVSLHAVCVLSHLIAPCMHSLCDVYASRRHVFFGEHGFMGLCIFLHFLLVLNGFLHSVLWSLV